MKSHDAFKDELLRRREQRTQAKHRRRKILITCTSFILCLVLVAVMLLRPATVYATDLMVGIKAGTATGQDADEAFISVQADFALRLFKACAGETAEQNTLISPLSVMLALSMTANGADGQTKSEMESVLGMPIADLNRYLYSYVNRISASDTAKVSIANSVWYRDADWLHIQDSFLQTAKGYYDAAAYKAPFDDSTVRDINNWTRKNTDGMIDKIVDSINDETVMYLINALVFDAKWQVPYTRASQIRTGTFHAFDGSEQPVTMMLGSEETYLDDGMATGFLKYYKGQDYAFVALLPNEGVSIHDYVNHLTGENLLSLLRSSVSANVRTTMPKFSYDYDLTMNEILKAMGMSTAFDQDHADFSPMGTADDRNICIGTFLHKTHISVDSQGTRAAAVSKVTMTFPTTTPLVTYTVTLDRPFVYLIIHTETNLPLFIGTVLNIN